MPTPSEPEPGHAESPGATSGADGPAGPDATAAGNGDADGTREPRGPRSRRTVVVAIAAVLVVTAVVVGVAATRETSPEEPAAEEPAAADGPYVVLLEGGTHPDVPLPVWVDGLPGAVGKGLSGVPNELALVVVRDGVVDVRAHMTAPRYSSVWGYADGRVVLQVLDVIPEDAGTDFGLLRLEDERLRPLPRGTTSVAVDPAGTLWVGPGLHEVPAAEVAAGRARDVDAWPEAEVPDGVDGLVPGPGRFGWSWDSEVVVDLGDGGEPEPVLGEVRDPACGLNRRAASSYAGPVVTTRTAETPFNGRDMASDGDGALWLALAAPPPAPPGSQVLGRVTPDGLLEVVDHPLPGIEAVVPAPDSGGVLVADRTGRVLLLPGPEALESPGPVPDDCYEQEPEVAGAGRFTALPDLPSGAIPLDVAGTALAVGDHGPDGEAGAVRRIAPDGTATEVAPPGRVGPVGLGDPVLADGAGGAWWVELAPDQQGHATPGESPQLVAAHLTADGDVERSEPLTEMFGSPQVADADAFYPVADDGRLLRVTTDGAEPVSERNVIRLFVEEAGLVLTGDDRLAVTNFEGAPAVSIVEDNSVEPLAGRADESWDPGADRPPRPLAIQLDLATAPDELHLTGHVLTDPFGDGVLVVQDRLLVRIAADGTVTPLVQDDRLDNAQSIQVLDGHLVVSFPPVSHGPWVVPQAADRREVLVMEVPR